MQNSFSLFETQLVKSLLSKVPDEDIASMLDRPVQEVTEAINLMTGGVRPDVTKPAKAVARKTRQPVIPKVKKKKRKEPVVFSRVLVQDNTASHINREKRHFKTKAVDYAKMQTVRIDPKTFVYAKADEDPAEVKRKYFENLNARKNISPSQRNSSVEVKKFKPIKQ
jgi:hypothetical protein